MAADCVTLPTWIVTVPDGIIAPAVIVPPRVTLGVPYEIVVLVRDENVAEPPG